MAKEADTARAVCKAMGKTSAEKNRKARQDNLREWLSKKCTAQHLVDNIKKIESLDESDETFSNQLSKLKTANEQRLKVLNKYLPDLKATEITGDSGGELTIQVLRFADTDTK